MTHSLPKKLHVTFFFINKSSPWHHKLPIYLCKLWSFNQINYGPLINNPYSLSLFSHITAESLIFTQKKKTMESLVTKNKKEQKQKTRFTETEWPFFFLIETEWIFFFILWILQYDPYSIEGLRTKINSWVK